MTNADAVELARKVADAHRQLTETLDAEGRQQRRAEVATPRPSLRFAATSMAARRHPPMLAVLADTALSHVSDYCPSHD